MRREMAHRRDGYGRDGTRGVGNTASAQQGSSTGPWLGRRDDARIASIARMDASCVPLW